MDGFGVFESSIEKWTAHFVVEKDKARKGRGVGRNVSDRIDHFNCVVITVQLCSHHRLRKLMQVSSI